MLLSATRRSGPALIGALACALALAGPARADVDTTREALERLDEILELRQEDGLLDPREIVPTLLVQASPRYEASLGAFPVQAISTLTRRFGPDAVRVCEACMALRTEVAAGRVVQQSGPIALDEIRALDDRFRGSALPARSATWIQETQRGVAVRIVELRSGRVLFAQNIEPDLRSYRGTARTFQRTEELERRARGDGLTHAFFDAALYPGQHLSMEWADQFGDTNANLAGAVFSLFDPIIGIGASYHRVLEFQHITVGGQVLLSVPTAIAQGVADTDAELLDPALTAVAMLRWPFGRSNYAGLLTVSTNGAVGVGISFLNTSFIPVLP